MVHSMEIRTAQYPHRDGTELLCSPAPDPSDSGLCVLYLFPDWDVDVLGPDRIV